LKISLNGLRVQPSPAAPNINLILAAGSGLCAAVRAVGGGKACDQLLLPVVKELENSTASTASAQPGPPSNPQAPPLSATTATLDLGVRVSDEKLDAIYALSEDFYYAAALLRMRQDQLDTVCEDFAAELAKRRTQREPPLEVCRALLNRLEDTRAALERSSCSLQKVSAGLEEQLGGLRLVSLGVACRGFNHAVRDLAVALGKEVDFSIEDSGTELDRSVVELLREPLLHLIRNAIDHGLEPPDERRAEGKPPRGQLRIIATPKGSWAEIAIVDDGRGIDPVKIRQRAAQLRLPAPADDAACMALLFRGGVSTARQVTEISGRGLGLSIVRTRVEQLHGRVSVASTPGQGSRFVMVVPMTLSRMRLLFVAQGANVFGIPSSSVQRLMRSTEEQVTAGILDGSTTGSARLLLLAAVLGLDDEARHGAWREAFVLYDGARQAGFVVHGLLREDEAVIKSLGPRLKSTAAYLGGTLLPDGGVALVLNPDYLMNAAVDGTQPDAARTQPPTPQPAAVARRVILAEDSDILRALSKRFLEQAGFRVEAAADGRQALEMWNKLGADLVVTDFEMPLMDGLELTRAIRQQAGSGVKIILLSASDNGEIRAAAKAAGADVFLVKGPMLRRDLVDAAASVA
jgi:two-component system chemotaxis sensor kinase CheA